jgi:hypothetical protein
MFHIQLSLIGIGSMKFIYVNVNESPQDIMDRVCALTLNMVLMVDDSQLQKL